MKNNMVTFVFSLLASAAFSQAGHIMQGVGAVNMSMGGAATAQPIDISGALQWNPAAISVFNENQLKLDVGLFFSSPELSSTVPEVDGNNQPTGNFISGTTADDRGVSILPSVAYVWTYPESKHTLGISAFGISGFGVTFPESTTNPINMPQSMNGFGRVESDYSLLQVGLTWAYELTDQFSIGVEPTFNFATLELIPNPTANPTGAGYPSADKTSALGFGAQFGLFYNSPVGFKAGLAYKTKQAFKEFSLDNTYLDNSTSTNEFKINYPAIFSVGLGYSLGNIDLALDYRIVDYENAEGFAEAGWTPTFSVAGFGWENINIVSAGIQYKGVNKLPLRLGYTYSSNPISSDLAFFSVPATAIIKNAFQFGFSYEFTDAFSLDVVYHYGSSGDATSGPVLSPQFIQNFPPYGAIPGSEVSYDMTTSMIMFGGSFTFGK